MLKTLTVGNFKSIAEPVTIQLSPLTLLCGANSSGKSSLMQALLLLAQSSYGQVGAAVQLNGPLVELGTVEEVSFRGSGQPITLGASIHADRRVSQRQSPLRLAPGREIGPLDASLRTELESQDRNQGFLRPRSLEFSARAAGVEATLTARRRRGGRLPARSLAVDSGRATTLSNSEYRLEIAADEALTTGSAFGYLSGTEAVDAHPLGVELTGPVPQSRWSSYSPVARQVDRVVRSALRLPTAARGSLEQIVSTEAWPLLRSWWADETVTAILGRPPNDAPEAYDRIRATRVADRAVLRANLSTFLSKYEDEPDALLAYERLALPTPLDLASDLVLGDLREVRHLGPLRESPRPFYSLPTSGDPLSVGKSGEFTAAVLTRLADATVSFGWDGEKLDEPLGAAVNRWLTYLGVHSEARALELGKFGHFVGVTDPALPRFMDLTQVGVGVSQLLPVLVQGLVAPAGSVLLLEQPELHLHPAVQSRLAVFIASLAQTERLVLCETHSEYFVTRIRLMVADHEISGEADLQVYYTSRLDGRTVIDNIEFGRKATMSHWPDGFFDQSTADASALLDRQLRE